MMYAKKKKKICESSTNATTFTTKYRVGCGIDLCILRCFEMLLFICMTFIKKHNSFYFIKYNMTL